MGKMKPSRGILSGLLERRRERMIRSYIKDKILDLGCGPSNVLNLFSVKAYYGVDIKRESIERLKAIYPQHKFFVKNMESDKIVLDKKVNTVIMTAFLEHIENYLNPIEQSLNNLETGGKMLITTPSAFGHKVHAFGARLGLFSREAKEDHRVILTRKDFVDISKKYKLRMRFKYFQFFCNQLVVFEK